MIEMLDQLMHRIITQLELLSHAGAVNTDTKTARAHPATTPPPRMPAPHMYYRRAYSQARSEEKRREVVEQALAELRSIRYSRKPNVDRETREGRLTIGLDPRPVNIVAYVYDYTPRHIYRLRAEAKKFRGSVRWGGFTDIAISGRRTPLDDERAA